MWTMPETGIRLFFGAAHPQKGVPQVLLQEGCWSLRWQTNQWQRQQQPWGFFQGDPQKGQQGSHCQLPGLQHPFCISAFTMLQQTGTSHHKSHKKDSGERQKKVDDASLAQRGARHKAHKDRGHC